MFRIRKEPLEAEAITRAVEDPACGAVACFAGVVRNENHGRPVEKIHYEVYEPMAIRKMEQIAETLREKWDIRKVAMEHRVGDLQVGETSIVMALSSPHRKEAFEAIRHGMDLFKTTVPIFKREFYRDGTDAWIGC